MKASPPAGAAVLRVGPTISERVRWSDVDVMGIVQFARYLRFVEAAETEFFRALGFTYAALAEEHGVWLARVHLACDYRTPARLDDEVCCRAELRKIGGSTLTFAFPIDRADGARLVDAELILAALERSTLRPTRLPAALAEALRTPG